MRRRATRQQRSGRTSGEIHQSGMESHIMWKKISAVLTAVLVALGFSVAADSTAPGWC